MPSDQHRPFISAEDFDATGILTGVDPCASNYWWMPELYGPDRSSGEAAAAGTDATAARRADRDQATRRSATRSTAAA
jgi:hypothetical protein